MFQEGDVWPNSSADITVYFNPLEARLYQQTIYCDISGMNSLCVVTKLPSSRNICICVYVCVHMCVCVCKYVCIHVYVYSCVCIDVCVCESMCVCVCVHVYMCKLYVYVCICVRVCVQECEDCRLRPFGAT